MTRPLLALVAIVRNEANNIEALLESVKGVVDHVTIYDTDSSDGTVAKITSYDSTAQVMVGAYVPFDGLPELKLIDYARTRNFSLSLEAEREDKAVFTLCLSGDETLQNGEALRAFLEEKRDAAEGAYCLTMQQGESTWPYARILRVDSKWRYTFPVHEFPVGPNGETMGPLIPGVTVKYAPTDEARLARRHREVDLPILTYISEQKPVTHEDHIARARALLFLAQTHEILAKEYDGSDPGSPWLSHQMAAMAFYRRRAELGGDPVDVHFSLLHHHLVAGRIGMYSHEEFIPRFQALAAEDPERPEVRYQLAFHASQVDPRQAAFFAAEAIAVARAAKVKPLPFQTDARIEWLSLQIAAESMSILKMPDAAKKLANEGIAAGGPQAAFADWL